MKSSNTQQLGGEGKSAEKRTIISLSEMLRGVVKQFTMYGTAQQSSNYLTLISK